jgi:hypothetical protein
VEEEKIHRPILAQKSFKRKVSKHYKNYFPEKIKGIKLGQSCAKLSKSLASLSQKWVKNSWEKIFLGLMLLQLKIDVWQWQNKLS